MQNRRIPSESPEIPAGFASILDLLMASDPFTERVLTLKEWATDTVMCFEVKRSADKFRGEHGIDAGARAIQQQPEVKAMLDAALKRHVAALDALFHEIQAKHIIEKKCDNPECTADHRFIDVPAFYFEFAPRVVKYVATWIE